MFGETHENARARLSRSAGCASGSASFSSPTSAPHTDVTERAMRIRGHAARDRGQNGDICRSEPLRGCPSGHRDAAAGCRTVGRHDRDAHLWNATPSLRSSRLGCRSQRIVAATASATRRFTPGVRARMAWKSRMWRHPRPRRERVSGHPRPGTRGQGWPRPRRWLVEETSSAPGSARGVTPLEHELTV